MIYEWDETKRRYNMDKHGLDFTIMAAFSWKGATILADTRREYQESRFVAFGYADGRLLTVVFTPRDKAIRLISVRKSNDREIKRHGKDR
jgi:uncharacterized DUF497 family protein